MKKFMIQLRNYGEIASLHGDISTLVPPAVSQALLEKYRS